MARKHRGHFCPECGRVLPNGNFTGREHWEHVCDECTKRADPQTAWILDDPDFSPLVRMCLLYELESGTLAPAAPKPSGGVELHPAPDRTVDDRAGDDLASSGPQSTPAAGRSPSPEQVTEDLLLMLLYLSATRNEELDPPRSDRRTLDLLFRRLEAAGLITIHKMCFMLTELGESEAYNLLIQFGLERVEK